MTGRDASGIYGIQMFSLRREQGRLAELAPVIRVLASGDGPAGAWRPGLAVVLSELRMEDDARRELARIREAGLETLRSALWLGSLTYLADACSALGDEATAALVYPELEPLAGTNVMIGHGVAIYGAADRYLGMLATTLGEWSSAERHFEAALEMNREMGADTWLAHTAYEFGRMLLARGGRDDRATGRPAPRRGGSARRANRHADAARASAGARVARRRGRPAARRPLGARGADTRPRRSRPLEPGDRHGARDQRAHGGEPHPQHPAQDGLRQPHRGCVVRPPPRAHGLLTGATIEPCRCS